MIKIRATSDNSDSLEFIETDIDILFDSGKYFCEKAFASKDDAIEFIYDKFSVYCIDKNLPVDTIFNTISSCIRKNSTIKIEDIHIELLGIFKFILFYSKYTGAVYSYNGFDVICIRSGEDRQVGAIMHGFNDVDFDFLFKNKPEVFYVGDADYSIIEIIDK